MIAFIGHRHKFIKKSLIFDLEHLKFKSSNSYHIVLRY